MTQCNMIIFYLLILKDNTPVEIPQSRSRFEINRSTNEETTDLTGGNQTNVNLDSMGNNCMGDWIQGYVSNVIMINIDVH